MEIISTKNIAICDNCHNILRYNIEDVETVAFGYAQITCPKCGNKMETEDYHKKITLENIDFPKDFASMSCNITPEIQDEIKRDIIRMLKKRPKEHIFLETKGYMISIYPDEDEYSIYVSTNYFETYIEKENIY